MLSITLEVFSKKIKYHLKLTAVCFILTHIVYVFVETYAMISNFFSAENLFLSYATAVCLLLHLLL